MREDGADQRKEKSGEEKARDCGSALPVKPGKEGAGRRNHEGMRQIERVGSIAKQQQDFAAGEPAFVFERYDTQDDQGPGDAPVEGSGWLEIEHRGGMAECPDQGGGGEQDGGERGKSPEPWGRPRR